MPTRARTSEARRLEYLPLGSLQANVRNPRTHDEATIDASVGRFGYLEPIVRDERTGLIVSGHGRAIVLREMKARGENVPEGCRLDKDGEWLVPVVVGWGSRTDAEASAALIALNRTTELGGWVDDALLELLDDLAVVDGGLAGVGFGDEEMTALRERLDAMDQSEFLEDLAEQDSSNPFTDGGGEWSATKEVSLTFAFPSAAVRNAVTRRLSETQAARSIETQAAALCWLLDVPFTVPTPEPVETRPPAPAVAAPTP